MDSNIKIAAVIGFMLVCHWHDYSPQNTLWLGMTLTTLELLRYSLVQIVRLK
jgi:hypothetical protein